MMVKLATEFSNESGLRAALAQSMPNKGVTRLDLDVL